MKNCLRSRYCEAVSPSLQPLVTAVALVCMTFSHNAVMASPQNGVLVGGVATVSSSGALTTVNQVTDRAAIDWQSFSVAAPESVRFNQPSAASIMLNRVVGGAASEIFGRISANGQVFLINPNGVMFRPGAEVNVGGLLASSLDMKPSDFLSGRFVLQGNPANSGAIGPVINQGSLNAAPDGYIALAGPQVRNEGNLNARLGSVTLIAGNAMRVSLPGSGGIKFDISESAVNALVRNGGLIRADGGTVLLAAAAKDALTGSVINNTGTIEARSISNRSGVIRLEGLDTGASVNSGRLDASGKTPDSSGGTVTITGQYVATLDGSRIDVAGDKGGGHVNVGGSFQGAGELRNAINTFVATDALIDASAISSGKGGDVVVWADGTTRYFGGIQATGGLSNSDGNSNGGKAEVSGKNTLAFAGRANLSAPQGKAGTLLLDPTNITLSTAASANTTGFTLPLDQTEALADDAGLTSNFNISSGGSFAGVAAGTNIVLQATNKIDVNNSFALATATGAANVNLALEAPTVNLNGVITTDGTGVLRGNATTVNVSAAASIQNGVNLAANTGATVNVAAGTYVEQVAIVGKDLTLSGAGEGLTVIQSPLDPHNLAGRTNFTGNPNYFAIVNVQNTNNTVVKNLTIDGVNRGQSTDAYRFVGIGYNNAGGTIDRVTTTRLSSLTGQDGSARGIMVEQTNGTSKNLTISNTTQTQFGRAGIQIDARGVGNAIVADITGNTITGEGSRVGKFNQNGMVLAGNISGNVSKNVVSNFSYGSSAATAYAIGIQASSAVLNINNNTLTNNDQGVSVRSTSAVTNVKYNTIQGGQYGVTSDSPVSITNNIIHGNTVNSVNIFGASANAVVNTNSLVPAAGVVAVTNDATTGVIDGNNNWWGTSNIANVGPLVNNLVLDDRTSKVRYATILTSGDNQRGSKAGFEPATAQPAPVVVASVSGLGATGLSLSEAPVVNCGLRLRAALVFGIDCENISSGIPGKSEP